MTEATRTLRLRTRLLLALAPVPLFLIVMLRSRDDWITSSPCANWLSQLSWGVLATLWAGYFVGYPLSAVVLYFWRPRPNYSKYLVALWILCFVVLVVYPLYGGVEPRARLARARADLRVLSLAINAYSSHMEVPPQRLDQLARPARNAKNAVAGPFLDRAACPPLSWTYTYSVGPGGYEIVARGNGMTVSATPRGIRSD